MGRQSCRKQVCANGFALNCGEPEHGTYAPIAMVDMVRNIHWLHWSRPLDMTSYRCFIGSYGFFLTGNDPRHAHPYRRACPSWRPPGRYPLDLGGIRGFHWRHKLTFDEHQWNSNISLGIHALDSAPFKLNLRFHWHREVFWWTPIEQEILVCIRLVN